jgi:hypothetical protein
MPEPLWSGLNRALPLQQPLQLNFYREAEKIILRTELTVFNVANINILIQGMLAKNGFDRSVCSVSKKRWRMGLGKESEILRIENIAIEYWNLVEGALVSRFHGKFAFLTRAEQAEEIHGCSGGIRNPERADNMPGPSCSAIPSIQRAKASEFRPNPRQ